MNYFSTKSKGKKSHHFEEGSGESNSENIWQMPRIYEKSFSHTVKSVCRLFLFAKNYLQRLIPITFSYYA
jgi:hypothetical protein